MCQKTCIKCGRTLPATPDFFYKQKSNRDGLNKKCRECHAKRMKKYGQENRESIAENKKKYYQEHKDLICAKMKQHYQDNKAVVLERARQYYQENKTAVAQRDKRYRESNIEKHRNKNQRREAKKRELVSTLTVQQWQEVLQYFNNKCAYCGKETELHQDHFVPLSRGGEYTCNNIIPSCMSCNSSKGAKSFFEWYPKQRFYSKKREKKILAFLNYKGEIQQMSFA